MKERRWRNARFARWKQGLRHAFALEEPDEVFSEEDRVLLNKVAGFVVKRGMTVPAVLFLESMRPLNFVGSQVMVFFQPILASFFSTKEYDHLARILERRNSIDRLIEEIEREEQNHHTVDH